MIEYKGYVGAVDYDAEIEQMHGTVINTRDVITFYGSSVDELRQEMAASVDAYLAHCAESGKEPDKPFSGKILVRTSSELHRAIATAAVRESKSTNAWIVEALDRAVERDG